ncbi:MAG: exo-alpha-sialidase, partial [Chloroflexi bacterium]
MSRFLSFCFGWLNGRFSRHLLFGVFFSLIVLLLLVVRGAWAQIEASPWQTPQNLSRSGATSQPVLVPLADGRFLVFWQDEFDGFTFTAGDGESWQTPTAVTLPATEPPLTAPGDDDFEGLYQPWLLATDNQLHVFWIDEDSTLWYSRAPLDGFVARESWTTPVELAQAVITLEVTTTENGRIHLTYIHTRHTDDEPAGIYYRRSTDNGISWGPGILLEGSTYFRTATAETAHLRLAAAADLVLVGWDNPATEQISLVRSGDGGESWSQPQEIDRRQPDDDPLAAGPAGLELLIQENSVHLTWRATHAESPCTQYHQISEDGGQTWLPPQAAFADNNDCPTNGRFFVGREGLLFLLISIREEIYLMAWDGTAWSDPEIQPPLVSFTDPDTLLLVNLDCLQAATTANNRLVVVGCGDSNADDIWWLERPLGGLTDWSALFRPTPVWQSPLTVASVPVRILLPQIVQATDGRLHALWSQATSRVTSGRIERIIGETGDTIYYARFENGRWTSPRPVLNSPKGKTDQIAIAADQRGNLLAVWSGGESGGIYFSRAVADRAASVTEWLEPQLLPAPREAGSWPDILVDRAGIIYVVYTIQLNEARGIYLVRSADNGNTWSDPIQIFNGVAAGWEMVGAPRLTQTGNGSLHLLWTRETLPDGTGPLTLVYARSDDGGTSWTSPAQVTADPVFWADIVGVGERIVHRVWMSPREDRQFVWHQVSLDNGLTWTQPIRISDPNSQSGPTTLVLDAAGTPHLLQLAESNAGQLELLEWVWNGSRWEMAEGLALGEKAIEADVITAVLAQDNQVGVLYAALLLDNETGDLMDTLFYTARQWPAPEATSTPLPTLT